MSRKCTLCNEKSLFSGDLLHSESLSNNNNVSGYDSYSDNFLGKENNTLKHDFLIACKLISELQDRDEILRRSICSNPTGTMY